MTEADRTLDRLRGAYAALEAECEDDGGPPIDADGLIAEIRAVVGEIDEWAIEQLLATVSATSHRNAAASGLHPVILAWVTGLRLGEKLGSARGMEAAAESARRPAYSPIGPSTGSCP